MGKLDQRGGFETRRFMREQGLGNPIRALWYITQVMLGQISAISMSTAA